MFYISHQDDMYAELDSHLKVMFQNTFGFLHARFQTGSARTQHKKQYFSNISVTCILLIRKIAMLNCIQKGRIYVANSYEYKVRIGTDYLLSSNFESKTI